MSTSVSVKWRDTYEAVDAAFGLDVAVCIGTFDAESRLADAGTIALGNIFNFDFEAAPFGPAGVHPEENVRPIIGLGATGTCFDCNDCI